MDTAPSTLELALDAPAVFHAPSCSPSFVAALYVESGGAYYGIPGVDAWDEKSEAPGRSWSAWRRHRQHATNPHPTTVPRVALTHCVFGVHPR